MSNSQKLDYIIKKLDQHDIYFQEIRTDISNLQIKVSNIEEILICVEKRLTCVEETIKNLDGYRERNNKSIEIEVTKSVFENLKKEEKSLYIINVSSLFPKKYTNESNIVFIEIDGLILGTNDREYASKYNKSLAPRIKGNQYNLSKNLSVKNYKLYIVEGKHNITKKKVIDKYEKYNKFKIFLSNIRNNPDIFTGKAKKIIDDFQLSLFEPSNITLIFGTPMWNEEEKQQIIKYIEHDPNIKMVTLSGDRCNL